MTCKNFLICCLLLGAPNLFAQQCSGNLGDNIFSEGDFGSGPEVVLPGDPGIAPGFTYQRNPPPNDGFYTITSNTGRWGNSFGSWDAFSDNSSDPNGYFMVVNANFEPGKFYEQRVDDLCENTLYQFTADIRNVLRRGTNQLMPNVSFSIDGAIRFTTGLIPEEETWNTYGFIFTTEPGQTSVLLALSNNAPGGLGNDLALDNISFRACGPTARIAGAATLSVCEDGGPATLTSEIIGDQYDDPALQWQQSFDGGLSWENAPGATGNTFDHTGRSSGFYFYRYLLANGSVNLTNAKCRVVSNVKTVFVVPKRYDITDTICNGLTYEVGRNSYAESGVSQDTLLSSLGCDSIITLRLTVLDDGGITGDFMVTDPSCSDRRDGVISLNGVSGGTGPYTYVLDSIRRGLPFFYTDLGEGDYAYSLTDRFGCREEGIIILSSPFPFDVDLGEDRVIELGERIRLSDGATDEVVSYVFTPAGIIDCTEDCDGQFFTPPESATVQLVATSSAGCEARDSVRYTVLKSRRVYSPTAFSPNNDGINDRFALFAATPNVRSVSFLRVYNRWGGVVFSGENLAPNETRSGWDGTVNGQPATTGLYLYSAEVVFLDGEVRAYSGGVTLLR